MADSEDKFNENEYKNTSSNKDESLIQTNEKDTEQTRDIPNSDPILSIKVSRKYRVITEGVPAELLNEKKRSSRKKDPVSYNFGDYNELNNNNEDHLSSEYKDQTLLGKKNKCTKTAKSALKKSKKTKPLQRTKKERKRPKNAIETIGDQINFLVKWKNEVAKSTNENYSHFGYYEFDPLTPVKWEEVIKLQNAQAILISPPWNYCNKGIEGENKYTFEDFTALNIPFHLMKHGIIFIWTKKEYMAKMFAYFKKIENTKYIENLVWGQLKPPKTNIGNNKDEVEEEACLIKDSRKKEIDINIDDRLYKRESTYFSNSCLTLLFFLRQKNPKDHLELRHQRNCDAVFDYYYQNDPNYTPRDHIYTMIETLLPNAIDKNRKELKMIEIFSIQNACRNGWVHLNYIPSNYP